MYSCACCKCKPKNIAQFLTVPGGCVSLAAYFNDPVIRVSEVPTCKWRLQTDGCGYDITYYTGLFFADGRLDPGTSVASPSGPSGWDSASKSFCSQFSYPEGIVLQVACCSADDLNSCVWADRPCLAGGESTGGE